MTKRDDMVDVKFSMPPKLAILFFHLLAMKDDGDFWKELGNACVAHSAYLSQTGVEGYDHTIAQLNDVYRIALNMGVSS